MDEEMKSQFEMLKKLAEQKNQHPCPSCGHCPTCGRGGYMQPYPYYPQPYWTGPTWFSGHTGMPLADSSVLNTIKVTC